MTFQNNLFLELKQLIFNEKIYLLESLRFQDLKLTKYKILCIECMNRMFFKHYCRYVAFANLKLIIIFYNVSGMLYYFTNRVISLTGITENYFAAQDEHISSRNKSLIAHVTCKEEKNLSDFEWKFDA